MSKLFTRFQGEYTVANDNALSEPVLDLKIEGQVTEIGFQALQLGNLSESPQYLNLPDGASLSASLVFRNESNDPCLLSVFAESAHSRLGEGEVEVRTRNSGLDILRTDGAKFGPKKFGWQPWFGDGPTPAHRGEYASPSYVTLSGFGGQLDGAYQFEQVSGEHLFTKSAQRAFLGGSAGGLPVTRSTENVRIAGIARMTMVVPAGQVAQLFRVYLPAGAHIIGDSGAVQFLAFGR